MDWPVQLNPIYRMAQDVKTNDLEEDVSKHNMFKFDQFSSFIMPSNDSKHMELAKEVAR